MPTLDEILKKMAEGFQLESSTNSSNINEEQSANTIADLTCPICKGVGFVYRNVPPEHPEFGKSRICTCAEQRYREARQKKLFTMSNLEAYREKTFDNFNPQGRMGLRPDQEQSLQLALNQSMLFARNRRNWLLLMGTYGCGKTHLAAAIANDAVSLGIPTLFTTVPDLLDWLRYSYSQTHEPFEERFESIRQMDLLVLDDLGTQNATEWAREKLFQIINFRYSIRKPTVITTNQKLEDMDARIRSRLEDRDLVNHVLITAPDYRSPFTEMVDPLQLSTLNLHQKQTFETFNQRAKENLTADQKSNIQKVTKACQAYAKNPSGWLLLLGEYGTGKTHLAASIANACSAVGENPMFVVVPDLLDHLRATFSPASNVSYDTLFDQVRSSPLLVLDDLGTQSATPWAREKLYQIFNFRYNAELPTVITSAQLMEEIDPRIRTRMLDSRICDIFELKIPPFRVPPSSSGSKRSR
ncbi:MAG: ATP-binding protein [Anaerolineae bacterium]|nr:ATP-binding protein [Anaerolineae bacterium]